MTIEKIVDYVLHTPHNTNKAILIAMLEELAGGKVDPDTPDVPVEPDEPDEPGSGDIIYDGGMEV